MKLYFLLADLAIFALVPHLDRLLQQRPRAEHSIQWLAGVGVGFLVVLDIVPSAANIVGIAAWIVAIVVWLVTWHLEQHWHSTSVHRVPVWLAAAGMMVHMLLDGMALSDPNDAVALPVAVLLHQVPLSFFLWSSLRKRSGALMATICFVAMAVLSVIGFVAGDTTFRHADGPLLAYFQAVVGGSLLHLTHHRLHHHHS